MHESEKEKSDAPTSADSGDAVDSSTTDILDDAHNPSEGYFAVAIPVCHAPPAADPLPPSDELVKDSTVEDSTLNNQNEPNRMVDSEMADPTAASVVGSNKKRGPKAKVAKKSKEERMKDLLETAREDARLEHENLKRQTLDALPEEYLSAIGRIAFAKWKNYHQPVLVMGPFTVPPGSVRSQWFQMFNNLKRQDRLEDLTYLVFWYGTTESKEAYSFLPLKKIVWYEDSVKKGHNILPAPIQKKIDTNRPLTTAEQIIRRGFVEMEEDIHLARDKRVRGCKVLEGYELLNEDDLQGVDDDDDEEDEEEVDNDGDEQKSETAKRSTKKMRGQPPPRPRGRPRKSDVKSESDKNKEGEGDKDNIPPKSNPPAKRGRPSKKKSPDHDDENIEDDGMVEEDVSASKSPAKRGRPPKRKSHDLAPEERPTKRSRKGKKQDEFGAEQLVQHEKSSPMVTEEVSKGAVAGDVDMDDIGDKDDEGEDDDDKDEDYTANEPGKGGDGAVDEQNGASLGKLARAGKRLGREKKEMGLLLETEITGTDEEITMKKQSRRGRKPLKEKLPQELERELYKRCQKKYVQLIEQWEAAVESKDVTTLGNLMITVREQVPEFSFFFMKNYIRHLMTKSKAIFQQNNSDLTSYHMLRKTLQEDSESKQKELPADFYLPPTALQKEKQRLSNPNSTEESQLSLDTSVGSKKRRPKPSSTDEGHARSDAAELPGEESVDKNPNVPISSANIPVVHTIKGMESKTPTTPSRPASAPAPKPERKKFTLGSFIRPASQESGSEVKLDSSEATRATSRALPKWMTATDIVAPTNPERVHAMEFFRQMTRHFPSGQGNLESIARGIEQAVFNWACTCTIKEETDADGSYSWIDPYWMKVHFVVAAISGKNDPGTLQQMIINGMIPKPEILATLNDDRYWDSYEGRPVSII